MTQNGNVYTGYVDLNPGVTQAEKDEMAAGKNANNLDFSPGALLAAKAEAPVKKTRKKKDAA